MNISLRADQVKPLKTNDNTRLNARVHLTINSNEKALPRLLTFAELENLPDPEWLIEGILQADTLVVLYGPPKSKKTFVALDWANSIATGQPWAGKPVKAGDVVYIAGEGRKGLPARIRSWIESHDGLIPDRLRVHDRPINIAEPSKVKSLAETIRTDGLQPTLIVVDTLARNFGDGDENQAQAMNAFVKGCDALRFAFPGCAVLVVHHSGKDLSKGGRGSTALKGALDTEVKVDSAPKMPTGTISCTAQKDAEEFDPMTFRLKAVGKSAALEWKVAIGWDDIPDQPMKPRAMAKSDSAVLAALDKHPDGLSYGDLHKVTRLAPRTFADAIKRLKTNGKIDASADGVYVRI
ncbi:helicase RepA family protein [Mesorhizobium sp. DCY119]|uniref:helicase RepA family protein n=1 Tax=Mesorhizobium sp. DCY119 TaxID=2108445 RepID=UPI000E6B8840|nr:helicase RepA family protein [Mesorhizobium sp. DCY119]RJG45864.1 hypothetical protein D3Y55_17475 [Mesorhizobium sp. DCY119]